MNMRTHPEKKWVIGTNESKIGMTCRANLAWCGGSLKDATLGMQKPERQGGTCKSLWRALILSTPLSNIAVIIKIPV
jgi:hypothetical protein